MADDYSLLPVDYNPFATAGDAPIYAPDVSQSLAKTAGNVGQGIVDWAAAPGRVAQGQQPETPGQWSDTDEAIRQLNAAGETQWGAQTALNLAGVNSPFAAPGAAGIFGGRLAATADHATLARAEKMTAEGVNPNQIWKDTGWFQGADNKWRFEIDDTPSQMNPNVYGTGAGIPGEGVSSLSAGQVWHPELYSAYPQLRSTEMTVKPGNNTGRYFPGFDSGDVHTIQVEAANPATARSVALHELQHNIQDIEGFAKGANAYGLKPGTPAWNIYQERLKAIRTPLAFDDFVKQAGYDDVAQAAKDYKAYIKTTKNIPQHIDRSAQDYAVREAYQRSAGEVEAHNVQKRLFMTDEERRAQIPTGTESYPRDQQIVNTKYAGPQDAIRAYHGSPYDFDKFDLSKIGTGEGAQAYGHGLYFAEHPETAQFYKNALTVRQPDIFKVGDFSFEGPKLAKRIQEDTNAKTDYAARSILRDIAAGRSTEEMRLGNPTTFAPAIDWVERNTVQHRPQTPGRMYEVNINAEPHQFLDWDKPFGGQSADVQRGIEKVDPAYFARNRDEIAQGDLGQRFKRGLLPRTFDPAVASRVYNDAGIPGIKYLDQGSRQISGGELIDVFKDQAGWKSKIRMNRPNGEQYFTTSMPHETRGAAEQWAKDKIGTPGTSNYVVFDDKLINILRKYGVAGLGAFPAYKGLSFEPVDHDPFAKNGMATGGAVKGFANGGRVDHLNIEHNPTKAQKEAGNYAKDHVRVHGLDISIENAKGHYRRGMDRDGKPWAVKMPAHYGYIKGTVGKDKDHVDVYLGDHIKSPLVFVVDQMNADTQKFDEHKAFIGFASRSQTTAAYHKAFSDGRAGERMGHVTTMTIAEFKHWLERGDTTKPAIATQPTINRTYDVPYLAGSSNDDKTVYIDRRVPRRIAVRRAGGTGYTSIDPGEFLAAHEIAEHKAMIGGKSYESAHVEDGTVAERELVKKHGIDWDNYEKVMDGLLSHIEHEHPKRPPPDLYVKPYPHDKAKLLQRLATKERAA